MKWIFYLLLLVNIGMGLWYFSSVQEDISEPISSLKDVGDLKIVSDVELKVRADFQKDDDSILESGDQATVIKPKNTLPINSYKTSTATEVVNADGMVCRQLGPFDSKQDAVGIANGLISYRLAAKVKINTDRKTVGYWAILPPLASSVEADELVKKLKESGLVDLRRFLDGEMENAISLGLFSTKLNAIKRSRVLEKMGYITIIQPKVNEVDNYWLEYLQKPDFVFPMADIKTGYPDLEIKSCSGIASSRTIP